MKKLKKDAVITVITNLLVALVIVGVLAVSLSPHAAITNTSGGEYSPYYSGDKSRKYVSLMFNVYQNTEVVDGILEKLAEHGAKATFFVGGCWADDNAECLNRIVGGGHELGNHGYFHKDHSKLSLDENRQEIYLSGLISEALCGVKPMLFAPPSGAFNKYTLEAGAELGYKVIMWSKDTVDWRDKNKSLVIKRATKNLENGDLVLMHPMPHTLEALDEVLDFYKNAGFKTVTVSENITVN